MRRILAAALACAVMSAHAAEQLVPPTRVSPADWTCEDASGQVISPHQRFDTALFACLNNPAGAFIQGGRYRVNRPSAPDPEPEPATCPAPPASTTQPQDCPTGSVGTWTQTSTSTVGAPPACAVTTTWSPSSPPPGACNRPPTITGTPTAAVVAGQPYSFVPVAADPDADTLAFTIVNRPTWATFNAATGALTGTPAVANVSVHSSIVITVSDGKSSASTSAFSITVTAPPATTLPAVGGVSATTSPNTANPGNHNVHLSWLAVTGATRYEIERCIGATCTDNFIPIDTETNTAYTNSNLPGATTYRYRIRGTAGAVLGAWSALRTVTTPTAPTTPPPPPPPPAATGTAKLSWSWNGPPLDTDGNLATIAGYRFVYSTVGDAGPSLSQTLNLGPVLAHEFTGLTPGRWAFAIIAIDTQGRTSQQSNLAYRDVQ